MRPTAPLLAATPDVLRRAGIVATGAALLATASDLTLLWFATVPAPPAGPLTVATYVGALAILGYAVGYWQVACGLVDAGARAAMRVFLLGAATAGVGAAIHGMTGVTLHYEALHGGDVSAAHVVATLLPLWLVGVACSGVTAALYAAAILRGPTAYPRWMAAANPVVLSVAIAALAVPFGSTAQALVVPAAPNVAHVVFFALTTAALGRGPERS